MERRDWLLLFLSLDSESTRVLDPIRIMKGLFVFAKEVPIDWVPSEARYNFTPYAYGPCSFQIYRDLDELEKLGYISASSIRGQSWKLYSLTKKGMEAANKVALTIDKRAVDYLTKIRRFVLSLSFHNLLRIIYRNYPEYAVNSVFKF